MKKTYLIAMSPEPIAVPVKKEWEYKGFHLFLHRNYWRGYNDIDGYREGKQWKVSEISTGLSTGNAVDTMSEAIASAHAIIDKFLFDPSRKPADLLASRKILNA